MFQKFKNWINSNGAPKAQKLKINLDLQLDCAYCFDDIIFVNKLIMADIDSYTPQELITALKKVNRRLEINAYVDKIFVPKKIFPAWQVNHLFKIADNEFEVDAILYHINQNALAYAANREFGLQIFLKMANRRRIELIDRVFLSQKQAV